MSTATVVYADELDYFGDEVELRPSTPAEAAHHLHVVYEVASNKFGAKRAEEIVIVLDTPAIPVAVEVEAPNTIGDFLATVPRPRDPHTRLSLGDRTTASIENSLHRMTGEDKNRGHRQAPMKKRGDTAKKLRKARHRRASALRTTALASLLDQLDELTHSVPAAKICAQL